MAGKRTIRRRPRHDAATGLLPLDGLSQKSNIAAEESADGVASDRVAEATTQSGYRVVRRAPPPGISGGETASAQVSDTLISGFGANPFDPYHAETDRPAGYSGRPTEMIGGETSRELREQVQSLCPPVPGVYGMFDRTGELIYVGKSSSLRNRLSSYFGQSARGEKAGRIIEHTRAIQWETQPSDFAAQLREQSLIRRWIPRFNVQGVPERQRPVYLCLGRKPAEMFYIATSPPAKTECVAVEGPFFGAGRMGRVVDALNKTFRLRDCSQQTVFQFSEQLALFDVHPRPGCLRLEIGTCLGPCAAACSREEYAVRVREAESFLDGFNDEPITATQSIMENASANRLYELAARARDTLKSLNYAQRKLGHLADARQKYSFVYASTGYDGRAIWYLIRRGEIVDVAPAPADAAHFREIKPLMKQWASRIAAGNSRVTSEYPYTVSVVAAWFRKNRAELKQCFAPESAGRKYRHLSRVPVA
ncbi:GIY-YIG nuclease family protein [Aporhodopirellula aestuarii]|uniref:GIY-YIG nuclease family protein n=1 Tax=Aporhodopirellula aestuarii TaxID=2950107 RepID=A0ABT0U0P2_9BACT|nr:GIY-YIG nuclease family protein [Aporhodopirellula aestuarii]MCM2370412.1 GIY-YIG nuclease family protein [Aporhodopirellula aestuarii]